MKKIKLISALVTGTLLLGGLVGCGSSDNNTGSTDDKNITIAVTAIPHKEIVDDVVVGLLEEKGYSIKVLEFTDYPQFNAALDDKEIDANFFQHVPYLEDAIENNGYDITYTAKVHIEPMGLYSDKSKEIKDVKDIKDGAQISIPSDSTNGSRALRLLADNGIIEIKGGKTLKENELVSILDITKNPKNIKITELDAAQLSRTLSDVEVSVINTNYALEAGLDPMKDAIVIESSDSPYANILAVRTEDKDSEKIKALTEALTSKEVKEYIEEKYDGSIIPAF